MTRTTRTIRTLLAAYSTSLLNIGLNFVITPLVLIYLGNEGYGAFRVAADYLSYFTLIEIGIIGALQVALAKSLATGNARHTLLLLRSTSRNLFRLSIVITILILAFSFIVSDIMHLAGEISHEMRIGMIIAAFGCVLLPLSVFRPLAESRQRGYIVHFSLFLQNIITSIASLLLLYAGFGLVGMFLATLVGNIIFIALLIRDGRELAPVREVLAGPVDAAASQELRALNWLSIYSSLLGRLAVGSDNIILSLFISTDAVTPFILTLKLPSLAMAQLVGIGSSTWAALSDLYHQNLLVRMNARLIQLTRLTAFIGLAAMVPIAVANGIFVKAWVGPANDAGWLIALFGCANAWILSISSLWYWIINGTGHLRGAVRMATIGTVVNVVVSVLATILLGPVGPLVGTACQQFGFSIWWAPQLLHRYFGTSRRELFRAILGPLALAIPLVAVLMPLANSLHLENYALSRLVMICIAIAMMIIVGIIYVVLGWYLVLSHSDREEVRSRIFRRK